VRLASNQNQSFEPEAPKMGEVDYVQSSRLQRITQWEIDGQDDVRSS